MSKNTIAIAKNVRRETAKASRKSQAVTKAAEALKVQRDIETGAFDYAKGAGELLAALKAGMAAQIAEHLLRAATMRGAMVYRLGKALPEDDKARRDLMSEADKVLALKDASFGKTDAYRTPEQQRAYEASKKIWQRMFKDAKGEPRAKAKRKPQPAKGATATPATPTATATPATPVAAPLNFAEYVRKPPAFSKPADVNAFARNLAALMSNELKVSAKAIPGDVRAMFAAFISAAKALPDIEK